MCPPVKPRKLESPSSKLLFNRTEAQNCLAVFVQAVWDTAASFSRETTLHGVKNIVDGMNRLVSKNATR